MLVGARTQATEHHRDVRAADSRDVIVQAATFGGAGTDDAAGVTVAKELARGLRGDSDPPSAVRHPERVVVAGVGGSLAQLRIAVLPVARPLVDA